MTPMQWLPGATIRDLSGGYGNGPFDDGLHALWGVILHVNVDESGTPITFWGPGNPGSVTPNFQVFKDGSVDQLLPFNWQPWCQINGNYHYAAIETAGLPSEPLTDAQIHTIAQIMAIYHAQYGVPLVEANLPTQRGLGTHSMGGAAWGGHACPGDVRAAQRQAILDLAGAAVHPPAPTNPQGDMVLRFYKYTTLDGQKPITNRDAVYMVTFVQGVGVMQEWLQTPEILKDRQDRAAAAGNTDTAVTTSQHSRGYFGPVLGPDPELPNFGLDNDDAPAVTA